MTGDDPLFRTLTSTEADIKGAVVLKYLGGFQPFGCIDIAIYRVHAAELCG